MAAHTISEAVKAWRTAKGYTLTQGALRIGVAVATLFQWEAGAALPSPMAIPSLAEALGRSAADLAGMVARERAARLVGKRVVERRVHGGGSRPKPTRAGAA